MQKEVIKGETWRMSGGEGEIEGFIWEKREKANQPVKKALKFCSVQGIQTRCSKYSGDCC